MAGIYLAMIDQSFYFSFFAQVTQVAALGERLLRFAPPMQRYLRKMLNNERYALFNYAYTF
jgi:hypothetical protein